jgi:hypothetical protein
VRGADRLELRVAELTALGLAGDRHSSFLSLQRAADATICAAPPGGHQPILSESPLSTHWEKP